MNNLNSIDTCLKVRYAETDQMGVVYHANYLIWFEVGRAEYFKVKGCPYVDLEKQGIYFPVIEALCQYRVSARYGDEIIIKTDVEYVKPTRIKLVYTVIRERDEKILAEGYTVHAFVSKKGKPLNIRKSHPEVWSKIRQVALEG